MATVYRIQDKDGRGPFKPGFSSRWVELREDHDDLVPWFVEFGRVDMKCISGMAIGSACRTVEQLRRWFSESEYKTLKAHGYQAVEIDASIVAESQIQCFIQRPKQFKEDVKPFNLYGNPK